MCDIIMKLERYNIYICPFFIMIFFILLQSLFYVNNIKLLTAIY